MVFTSTELSALYVFPISPDAHISVSLLTSDRLMAGLCRCAFFLSANTIVSCDCKHFKTLNHYTDGDLLSHLCPEPCAINPAGYGRRYDLVYLLLKLTSTDFLSCSLLIFSISLRCFPC